MVRFDCGHWSSSKVGLCVLDAAVRHIPRSSWAAVTEFEMVKFKCGSPNSGWRGSQNISIGHIFAL